MTPFQGLLISTAFRFETAKLSVRARDLLLHTAPTTTSYIPTHQRRELGDPMTKSQWQQEIT